MKAFVAATAALLACSTPVWADPAPAPDAPAAEAAPATGMAAKPISYFYGIFQGDTTIKAGAGADSDANTRQSRVEITETSGGFVVTWSTLYVDNGNTSVLKVKDSTKIEFAKTDDPKVFKAVKPNELWGGKPYYWARVEGETLHVTAIVLRPDGTYDVADYQRTLEGDTMRLEFNRFKDGLIQRAVTGTLKRQAQ